MSWLSKKWEELSAQVNMRDGGKTASTVRANRQPVQPAQTKTPPKQNLWDRAVDVVSANTPADNYRRQQQQVDTTGTDEAMRMLQKQALSGQIDKNVAAAKIRALGTSDVQTNTAENVLKPTTPAQIAGQKVVDTVMNPSVAPVALGVGRSAAGTVEGVGGLYDLASPGDGVNRFSKVGVNAGQATDQAVKDNNYNQLAYKGSQAATDVAQYAIGAGGVKAVGKATTSLPYVPKVVSFADRVAQPLTKPISGAVERGATNLAQKGFTGRVASKTLQNVTNPGYQAVNAGFTALQAGKEASHGTEVSPIGVTTNLVAGGVGFPLAGAIGGEVARPIVNKAVSGLRKTNLVRPSNLKPGEVADLARMNEIAKTGAILDDNIYQRGVYAAQKAGIDHRDANQVDTLLGAHRNHDTLVQQRKQAIQDAKARVTRNPQTLLEPEGGYARIPVGKNDPAPDLSIEQKTLINDYAEMLQGMDDGNGVTILPDGSRASSNSQFYRKVFAEKGRAPSKADWFDEARRQIESGKAGFGASDDYKLLPSKDIGAVGKNVDPDLKQTFYKGFKKDGSSTGSGQGDAFYMSPYENIAKTYDEGVGVKGYKLADDVKAIDWKDPTYKAVQEKHMVQVPGGEPGYRKPDYNAINKELKSMGYDVVTSKNPDGTMPQIAVLNQKKAIEATQPQPVGKNVDPLESLKQEARKYKSAEEFDNVLQRGVTKPEFAPKPQQYNQLAPKPSKQDPLEALKAEARQATGARSDYSPENLQANRQIRAKNASSITYADKKAIKPDELVTVYRAVPGKAKGGLTEGDWVTPNKEQARLFMKQSWAQDDTGAKIVTKKVKASELRYHADDAKGYVDDELLYVPKSDPLEALKQEARKYKSAEEFVKAQGEPLYHRSQNKFDKFDMSKVSNASNRQNGGWGLYFSDSVDAIPEDAYGKYLYEVQAPKGTLLDTKNPVDEKIVSKIVNAVRGSGKNPSELSEFSYNGYLFYKTLSRVLGGDKEASLFLSKNGIDGLKKTISPTANDYILFSDKSIRTKQQLTDLYNQATKPSLLNDQSGFIRNPLAKDSLESLKQEARKYKSAEEFRKNLIYNDDIIIHQTGKSTADKIKTEGFKSGKETGLGEKRGEVYGMTAYDWNKHGKFSKDTYARDGSDVAEVAIDTRGLKIADRTNQKFTDEEYVKGIHKQIPEGYDGVKVGYGNGVNEVLLKPEVANARRFNIDDLYNQSQPPKSPLETDNPFKDSKIQEPIYHGTKSDFKQFDNKMMGSQTDSGMFGKGFYFTPNEKSARHYAGKDGKIKEVYLDMKNPYVINSQADIPDIKVDGYNTEEYSEKFTQYLKDRGYDGVIDNVGLADNQRIVFDASQIKIKESPLTKSLKDFNGNPIKKGDTVEVETIMGTKKAKVVDVTDGRYPEVKYKLDEDLTVGMREPIKAGTTLKTRPEMVNQSPLTVEKNPLEKDLQTAGVAPKKATDAEPPDFLKPTNAKGVIIKESKPQPDGTKIVVRATKNPETGKLQQFEERVDKNTDLPKAYEEPQVTERLAEYGKQAPEPRAPVTEVKGQAKKDLHESTNKFLGGYAGDKARNMGVARSLPKMNDEGSISIIDQIESGGDNSGLPTQIRAILDAKHKELKDAGVDIGYLQNYFPHRWVNEDKVKRAYQAVKLRASIQNERELPTVKEGIALGYKPKTKDYREAISDYLNTADKLLRNRTYFNELQKKNLILESYQPIPGMQVIDAPGLPKPRPHIDEVNGIEQQGNYYASPEVAKSLNRLFGDRKPHGAYEKTLDATAYVSRFLQDVGLAGGIPGTPLNAFTFAQVTKELLSGSIKNPIVATMKSFTKEGYRKYADQNNEAVQALQRQGIKIRDDYNFKNLGDEFTSMVEQEGGKKNMFAKGWDKVFSDPTFKRFMPSLQIEMFKKVQKGALKRGKTPEEAEKLAGDAVANFYGLNRLAKESFRSKPGTDAATTILFAPKYRESMINFLIVNNAKALNPAKWGAREYRQNQKFMVGAALMFAGENYANEYLNGVPMYQNPDGKKDKLIIPADRIPGKPTNGKDIAIPFLPSIATVPRYAGSAAYNLARGNTEQATKDASGFLSFGLRPLVDTFVTNENYFGDKIVEDGATPLDAAKQRGGYLLSQYQHPYIREAIRTKQGKNKSAFEAISKASEAPLRFYNPDTYRYDDKFVPKGPKGEKFTFSEQRDRAKTKKEIDGIADNLGLSKRQKADFASLSAVEFNEDGTLKEDNNPFYKSQRFTKLQDDGVFEAMKKKAQLNAKLNGKPVDPIFNLDGEARRLVLWKKTLPPGTSDPSVKKLYEQDWYQEFRKAEDKYYTSKKDWNTKMGYANQPEDKSYPVASKQIEEAQNAYFKLPKGTGQRSAFIRNNPDVWNKMTAFWEAKDQWTNGERSKLGLGPVDEPATTGGYAYGKSGGKGKGKNKSNFDYSKNLFGSNGTSSTSVSSNLRKILAKAMKS